MIYILLPAYNEEKNLPLLISRIAEICTSHLDYKIVVVNDGSSDATPDILQNFSAKLPLTVLNHPHNRGLGRAIQTGFNHIVKAADPHDLLITLDADNTHDPETMVSLIDKSKENYDVVIASRYVMKGKQIGVPWFRKLLSKGSGLLFNVFFPNKNVRDYTSGYRLYRISALQKAMAHYGNRFIEEPGFVCMVEILTNMMHLSFTISEVPLILRYDLKAGKSKIKIVKTIIQYIFFITKSCIKRIF
ncbi:MAG: glycosyltransferase family 2 protein [bacterium]